MIEQVILVDEQDNELGFLEKMHAHREGFLHRAFSVFLISENEAGECVTLLQQRQKGKYHCAGLWTNSCCSHPRPGEKIILAGERRCQEELGFSVPLQFVDTFIYKAEFSNGLCEHELDHVLLGRVQKRNRININLQEVSSIKWMTFEAIFLDFQNNKELYTPWFFQAAELVYKNMNGTQLKSASR